MCHVFYLRLKNFAIFLPISSSFSIGSANEGLCRLIVLFIFNANLHWIYKNKTI